MGLERVILTRMNCPLSSGISSPPCITAAIPGLAILPGFLIILFSGDTCKLLILQEPVLAEFPNRELLYQNWNAETLMATILSTASCIFASDSSRNSLRWFSLVVLSAF
jgi:hypothetical protein